MNLFVVAFKELLLLRRDRAGLLVLFVMPAILVVVITLVQENVMEVTGQKKVRMLILDQDMGALGQSFCTRLKNLNMDLTYWTATQHSRKSFIQAITSGEYQAGFIIPQGSSQALEENTRLASTSQPPSTPSARLTPIELSYYFDPIITSSMRNGITAQLDMAAELLSLQLRFDSLLHVVGYGSYLSHAVSDSEQEEKEPPGSSRSLLRFTSANDDTSQEQPFLKYNPTQQNVPAWALFGMFFTAIPIAGSILQERYSGIMARLISSPTSQVSFLLGKIITYTGICLCQFVLICLIGVYLFPLVGLSSFSIGQHPFALLLVLLCCGLAACGYGVLLGSACSTFEQASTIGATTIVVAATIGGIMVPVYAMPSVMQKISVISPLNWGVNAFQELLVRGSSCDAIVYDLVRLIVFFIGVNILAWLFARYSRTAG